MAESGSQVKIQGSAACNPDDNSKIDVTITGVNDGNAVSLSEDKKATVTSSYDWEGKKYTAEPDGAGGTYEAIVYSNVGKPTEGDKFLEDPSSG